MAEAKQGVARPLSPHLQIYRPSITMVMSIVHRLTGAALYIGTLLLAYWLVSLATGQAAFEMAQAVLGSWFGMLVLFGYTWALLHHMLGGLRHFVWDTARGLDPPWRDRLAWGTLVGSIALTAIVWAVGLSLRTVLP
jgi:succinate dehydrogenase / fumarate reductase, cytochrome b subunit